MRRFGLRVAELRELRGLTQEALAERIDVGVRTVQRFEAGTASPSFSTLCELGRALGAPLADLFATPEQRIRRPGRPTDRR